MASPDEEYRALREELARNQTFVFERPLAIVGAAIVGSVAASTADIDLKQPYNLMWLALAVGFLSAILIVMLLFNLFSTQDRMLTNSRIIAYLQLAHEEKRIPAGWERALHRRRGWVAKDQKYYLLWRQYSLFNDNGTISNNNYRGFCHGTVDVLRFLLYRWIFCLFKYLKSECRHAYKRPDYYTIIYLFSKGTILSTAVTGLTLLIFLYTHVGINTLTWQTSFVIETMIFGDGLVAVTALTLTHWWARPKKFRNSIGFNRELWCQIFNVRGKKYKMLPAKQIKSARRFQFILLLGVVAALAASVVLMLGLILLRIAHAFACDEKLTYCTSEMPITWSAATSAIRELDWFTVVFQWIAMQLHVLAAASDFYLAVVWICLTIAYIACLYILERL